MAITVRMISAFDGETHYAIHDGPDWLGRLAVRDGLARWIANPDDVVHWSVLAAVYRMQEADWREACDTFGREALRGWGIRPPQMPRCKRREAC